MAVNPTYPGVYVQEVPSGVRTIVGVSTSTGLLLGRASRGPIGEPVLCTSYLDFARAFGEDTSAGQLPHYVRLFFLNGGSICWVMRLANGADPSSVMLRNEGGADVLELTAKNEGVAGDGIRAIVRYDGAHPEATFTLELFRWEWQGGRRVRVDGEVWPNLSMNPNSPAFAPDVLEQNSKLVTALATVAVAAQNGYSQAGRPVEHPSNSGADFKAAWTARVGTAAAASRFQISVDDSTYVEVSLAGINLGPMTQANVKTDLATAIKTAIEGALTAEGITGRTVTVSFETGPSPATGVSTLLRITSGSTGDVFIRPAGTADLAVSLMLGSAQGGLEVGAHAARRPAPSGITLKATSLADLTAVAGLAQSDVTGITLPTVNADGTFGTTTINFSLVTSAAADRLFTDALPGTSPNDHHDGVREKLGIIAAAINDARAVSPAAPLFPWTARVDGPRLAIRATGAPDRDDLVGPGFATAGTDIATRFNVNTGAYVLGAGGLGLGGFHVPGTAGDDGTAPLASDYDAAYPVIDREVDLFNLMVLAPDAAVAVQTLYGKASVFAQKRRAVLLMDAPAAWSSVQDAIDPVTGVNSLRIGLVRDSAAMFFPRITIDENGRDIQVGPAGAIAGLAARIDGTRGVWKSFAGTEASLRGVRGLDLRFSDDEHGLLNPRGINTLRVFPDGIVNFGARTMDGDDAFASEWKYIAIRRLAYFIEESLYRGLKWVVFEPNDEPLWAQIRLNVGAFMHGLFQRGAFQGAKRDAYFVKCDSETTTQNDRNLGIVNIHVGFAPLKPAEFVILLLQQMAGQVEV